MTANQQFECDVLVLGTGIGGISAALAAHAAGARVIVIDKAPRDLAGGSTRLSGGGFRGPRSYYTPDDLYNDVMQVTHGRASAELTRYVVDNATSALDWLVEMGMQWVDPSKNEHDSWRPDLKARKVQNHMARPEPLELGGARTRGFGNGAVKMLHKTLFERVDVHFDTKAEQLLLDSHRRITGVRAFSRQHGYVDYLAPAVVLATGGFQANPEWRVRYFGRFADDWIVRGSRFSTGDGIKMAMEIGAAPAGQWGDFHTPVLDARSAKVECGETNNNTYPFTVMINSLGKRFVDEGEDYRDITVIKFGKEVLFQPGGVAYLIIDQKVRDLVEGLIKAWPPIEAGTLEELAAKIDVDAETMVATIKEFNAAVQPGEFNSEILDGKHTVGITPPKSNWAQTVDTPPFYAFPVTGGVSFGFGGITADTQARVLDTEGWPIEGLFAAGEIIGGLFYYAYPAGSSLTWATVFGRTAGDGAAALAKGQLAGVRGADPDQ
jgi:tricarballylate dehydrogenase